MNTAPNFDFPALAHIQHIETGHRFLVSNRVVDYDYDFLLYVLVHMDGPKRGQEVVIRAEPHLTKMYRVIER